MRSLEVAPVQNDADLYFWYNAEARPPTPDGCTHVTTNIAFKPHERWHAYIGSPLFASKANAAVLEVCELARKHGQTLSGGYWSGPFSPRDSAFVVPPERPREEINVIVTQESTMFTKAVEFVKSVVQLVVANPKQAGVIAALGFVAGALVL